MYKKSIIYIDSSWASCINETHHFDPAPIIYLFIHLPVLLSFLVSSVILTYLHFCIKNLFLFFSPVTNQEEK